MSRPKAYDPQRGYMYQILVRCPDEREYEHCDYAKDRADLKQLLENYSLAYGAGFRFKSVPLPDKYWKIYAIVTYTNPYGRRLIAVVDLEHVKLLSPDHYRDLKTVASKLSHKRAIDRMNKIAITEERKLVEVT